MVPRTMEELCRAALRGGSSVEDREERQRCLATLRRPPNPHEYMGLSCEQARRRELALVQAAAGAGFVGRLPDHLNALRLNQRAG